jgi:hypothetical protein
MSYTFDDLETEIRETVKRDDIDNLITRVMREAVNSICDEYPFSWLREEKSVQTIPGTSSYSIADAGQFGASDYKKRFDLRLEQSDSSMPLVYLSPDMFLNTFGINSSQGVPEAYTEWEGAIQLGPTPGEVFTVVLRYIKRHPSNGALLVPEKEIVKRATMMRLYIDLDMPELAQPHALLYEKLLIQLLGKEHHLDYTAQVRYRDL